MLSSTDSTQRPGVVEVLQVVQEQPVEKDDSKLLELDDVDSG